MQTITHSPGPRLPTACPLPREIKTTIYTSSICILQLSWKTGCWGLWTSLEDTEGINFVNFETRVGWQLYGKEPQFAWLGDIDHGTAVVGALAGGMHTIQLLFSSIFLLLSLSTLILSVQNDGGSDGNGRGRVGGGSVPEAPTSASSPASETAAGIVEGEGSRKGEGGGRGRAADIRSRVTLGRNCLQWTSTMSLIMVFTGTWCLFVGCIGFYLVVTRGFTDGLEV